MDNSIHIELYFTKAELVLLGSPYLRNAKLLKFKGFVENHKRQGLCTEGWFEHHDGYACYKQRTDIPSGYGIIK
jgi:hypothetical protein